MPDTMPIPVFKMSDSSQYLYVRLRVHAHKDSPGPLSNADMLAISQWFEAASTEGCDAMLGRLALGLPDYHYHFTDMGSFVANVVFTAAWPVCFHARDELLVDRHTFPQADLPGGIHVKVVVAWASLVSDQDTPLSDQLDCDYSVALESA